MAREVRIGAIVALAAAVAFLVWLFVRDDDEGASSATTTTTSTIAQNIVVPASTRSLHNLASAIGHPVYWAGPRSGMRYELTQTTDGRIYIRYLPPKVPIGDRHGKYLIVATYPLQNAYKAVQNAARESGAHKISLTSGGLAVYNDSSPANVYFALPGSNVQVEVYAKDARVARTLVTSGRITPIG